MFSVPVQFPANSRLGRTASIVQHIGALSVVTAIRRQPGYEVQYILSWVVPICEQAFVFLYLHVPGCCGCGLCDQL